MIALLSASGARNTEACDLRWSDLDFTHGKINVARSKTKRGVREIDMTPWLREELLGYRAAVGTPDLDAPVFPTRDGAHRTKDNLNRNVIRPVVRAANDARRERGMPPLPVAVTAHTFRRTYVTLMLEAGAPLAYVQDQVGHEDTKTTQEDLRKGPPPSAARQGRRRVQRADVRGARARVPERGRNALKRWRSPDAVAVRGVGRPAPHMSRLSSHPAA